jgi:hypothetical protein
MKTKNHKNKHFHQHIEQLLRHKLSVALVAILMFMGVASFDGRVRTVMQSAYVQGWDWVGHYLTHEHPMHSHNTLNMARTPTISGGPAPS